jgi:hypothetical protein
MQLQRHREIGAGLGWVRVGPEQTNCNQTRATSQVRKPSNLEGKKDGEHCIRTKTHKSVCAAEKLVQQMPVNIGHRACCIRSGWNNDGRSGRKSRSRRPCPEEGREGRLFKVAMLKQAGRQQLPKPPRACLIALSRLRFRSPSQPELAAQAAAPVPWRAWVPAVALDATGHLRARVISPAVLSAILVADQSLRWRSDSESGNQRVVSVPAAFSLASDTRTQASIHDGRDSTKSERLLLQHTHFFVDNSQSAAISNVSLYHQDIV